MFDIGAYLNCIKQGIVPKWFLQNTPGKLSTTNNTKLIIEYKTQALVFNNEFYLKTFFVVINDINHIVILGTLFIDMITPYKTGHESNISKTNGLKLVFSFLERPKTRN